MPLRTALLVAATIAAGLATSSSPRAEPATIPLTILPQEPRTDGDISRFGAYSDAYLQRRWRRMCATSARYDAMREAYDMRGIPSVCSEPRR